MGPVCYLNSLKGTDMKCRKALLALSVLGATSGLGLYGCGGSSNSHSTTSSGTAIDAYLSSATACYDTTGDKSCDDESSSTTTDINGDFSLVGATNAIILIESIATVTKERATPGGAVVRDAGAFTLTALNGATIVSPFTTLLQVGVEHGTYASAAIGEAAIKASLGLGAGITLGAYDFIDDGNVAVQATAEVITDIIESNIVEVEQISDDAGATYSDETIFETAILEIIDTDGVETSSDFDAVVAAVVAVVDAAGESATVATTLADTSVTAAEATASVDSTADATDVGDSLADVNEDNAEEDDSGDDSGTGGTGGTSQF